ncbi:MAG: hypothetical protein O9972_37230 [Burkholderiales bacterium]|jgi:hypothetical protein|nr:hypothetical protein [Burkholderiales bacterium]
MKALLAGLALILAGVLATEPASAQFYPGWGPPPPGYYEPRYDPRYDPRYRRPPPPPPYGGRDYYGYPPRNEYYGRPRAALRALCVTSRGNCSTGYPLPSGSPCRCHIPGFGEKRGQVP